MTHIFLTLLNMSITAGWIVLAVILLRFFLRKAPRWISCLLWAMVAIRLVLPFSVESKLSLIPDFSSINTDIVSQAQEPADYKEIIPQGDVSSEIVGENQGIPQNESNNNYTPLPSVESTEKKGEFDLFSVLSYVWIGGFALMLIYTGASYIRVRRRVAPSISYDKNIFICDEIDTPFILGVIKPRIYLPSTLSEADAQYVIAHEKAHLKRKDHLWKPLGFLLLSIYWFNPLLWLAYILLCRDIELACDEKVVKDFEIASKKDYSTALLNCSIPRKMISACPLAFGEVGVKARIKNVLSYKKPALWIICIALIACIVASVCLLTNPVSKKGNTTDEDISSESLSSLNCTFTAKELIYKPDIYNYIQEAEDAPLYQLTQNVLYEVNGRTKSTLGRITPIELDEEHFDTRFLTMYGFWTEPYSLEEIKKKNLSAAQVETENNFYQLLLQKDGSFLLVVGDKTFRPVSTSSTVTPPYTTQWIYTLKKEDSTFKPAGGFSRAAVLSKSYTEIIDTIVNAYPWNRNDGSAPIPDFPNASYMYIRHNNLNEVGFSITDLDNNGVDELIISPMDKSFVYDVYSTVEGETVHLFSSGERYTHTLYEGGYVHLGWSGGAAHSGHDFLKISDGKLEFIERITLDAFYAEESGVIEKLEDASDDNTFFKSKSEYTKDYIHISDDEALELIDSHLNKSEKLELYLIPLSNITTPETLTDAINVATANTVDFSDRATAVTVGTYSSVLHINNLYGNSVAELSEIFDDIKVTSAEKATNAVDITFRIESASACVIVSVYENDIIEVGNGYVSSNKGMAYYTSEGVYDKISSYYEELKLETEKNYTIEYISGTFQYHCVIKANDGTVLFDETSNRGYHIEAVDKDLIFLWQQAGTGTLTRGGQFYNLETKKISEPFHGIVDYCNGVVSSTGSGQVTLTLLDNPSQFQVIDEFNYPVSSFIENIADAKFVADGKKIKITYWTGENQNGEETKKITELFDVTLNAEV